MTKQNEMRKRINKKVIDKIHQLADMGLPDGKIVELTGASRHYVQKETTKFWKSKMKQKEDENE